MNELMNESINDEAVYRTAPATPGLLITQKNCIAYNFWELEFAIHFKQTECSRGCSINTFVINSYIQSVSDPFPPNLQQTFIPKPVAPGSWHFERMFTSLHLSHVKCHVSHVKCHRSQVTCQMLQFIYIYIYFVVVVFFWQSGKASQWRVCYQRGLPRLVFFFFIRGLKVKLICGGGVCYQRIPSLLYK